MDDRPQPFLFSRLEHGGGRHRILNGQSHGFEEGDFLKMKTAEIRVHVLPLLKGKIKVVRCSDTGRVRDHNEDAVISDMDIGLLALAEALWARDEAAAHVRGPVG